MPIPNSGQISLNDDINDTLKADTNETDVSLGDNNTVKFAAVADGATISGRSMSELRGQTLFQVQPDTEENGALGQSLHLDFPSSNQNYLSVVEPGTTSTAAYTRKKGTFSFWVKFNNDIHTTSAGTFIYSSGTNGSSRIAISVYSGSLYLFLDDGFYHRTNNGLILGQDGWYNIVVSIDTTKEDMGQSRCQAYVNGIEVFWDQHFVDITENFNLNFGTKQRINQYHPTSSYSSGDITYADCKYIDGLALLPTEFGELSEGIWIPKAYAKPSTDTIHTSNLQVHYKFEGNFEDSTSNNKDGTGIVAVTTKPISGGSADFNGTNSRMSTGYTFSGTQRTVTMWVYATKESTRQYLFGDYSSGGTDSSMSMACQINTGDQLYVMTGPGSGIQNPGTIDYKPHFEKWTHLAFVFNGTSIIVYIDNEKYDLGNTASSPQNGQGPLGLGTFNPAYVGLDEFQGFMGEVQLYNTNLTDAQIEKNYNANKHKYAYGPYGWHLPLNNDDQGSIVSDNLNMHLDAGDWDADGTDETSFSGSTWHDKENSNDGTISGASYNSANGGYFDFDGNDDKITVSGSDLNPSNTKSIEIWFNPDSTSSGYLISNWSGSGNTYGYHLYLTSGVLQAWVYSQAQNAYFALMQSGGTVTAGKWHHAVLNIGPNASDNQLYLNGALTEQESSTSGTFPTTAAHDGIFIGAYGSATFYNGKIAQVRAYSKQLTAQQVVQNFRATQGHYEVLSIVDKGPNAKRVQAGGTALTSSAHVVSEPTNNFATLTGFQSTYMTVGDGGLKPLSSSGWATSYANMEVTTGKWYYEVKITQANTINNASTNTANASYLYWGVHDGAALRSPVGNADILAAADSKAFMITDTGSAGTNSSSTSPHYGTTHINSSSHFAVGDVIGLALNADTGACQVYKNGSTLGSSVTFTADSYVPFANDYPGHGIGVFNFGQKEFEYAAPSGYKTWSTSNLTIGDINPEDKENPSDFFDVVTYNGTGTDDLTTEVNSLNFTPDLVLIKNQDAVSNWYVTDSVRGDLNHIYLESSSGANGNTIAAYGGAAIIDNGFAVKKGSTSSSVGTNQYGDRYVAYCFKGGGAPSSATPYMIDGTGYATASAASLSAGTDNAVRSSINTDAGISIVETGTYSTTARTYSHGLGVKPELVIAKSINDSQRWYVWYDGFNQNEYLSLNQNTAKATISGLWGSDSTPHSSTLIDWHGTNGHEYIMYSLVSVPGYSKIGTYEGNANANGPFIHTGFKPKFVLLKNIDTTGSWIVHDTTREDSNTMLDHLRMNSSAANDNGANESINVYSNGFKLAGNGQNANTSHTYIYLAIAEDSAIYNQGVASAQTNVQKFLEKGTGKSELPEEHFKTVLWTGNATERFIETGFKPGFIWSKKRTNDTKHHRFQDIVRGPGVEVYSPSNQAEFDGSADRTKSFNEKGFTIGTNASLNDNGDTFVGWVWRGGDSTVTKKPTYTDSGILSSNLALHYNFASTSYSGTGTTVTDISTNTNNGTLVNGPSWKTSAYGNYFKFDGSNDYIDSGLSTALGSGDFSIEMWIHQDNDDNWNMVYGDQYYGSTSGYGIGYYIRNGYFALWGEGTNSTAYEILAYDDPHNVRMTANEWSHLVITRSDGTFKGYINGVLAITNTSSSLDQNYSATDAYIMRHYNNTLYNTAGNLGQFRIYTSELTQAQIRANYNATRTLYQGVGTTADVLQTNLELHYDVDDFDTYTYGSTIYDKTSNNHDGTITNAVKYKTRVGNYLDFNGSSHYISISDNTDLRAKVGMTAEVWFKADSTPSSGGEGIFSKKISSGGQQDWILGFWTNTYQFGVDAGKNTSGGTVKTGVWTHLVGTYDGVSLNIYENGKLIKRAAASGTPTTSTSAVSIGRWYSDIANNYMFDGQVAQARFYTEALSKSQVKANYDATKAQFHSPLIHSEISLNDKAGFSIAKWTGTGIAGNIATGLSDDVGFAMVKRTDAAGDWFVWHKDVTKGNDKYLYLNYANAVSGPASTSVWNGGQFENKVINLGTNTQINTSDGEYIGYAWREIPGYCKIGTYQGNATTNYIEMGFRPKFVLLKSYVQPSNYNWVIIDFERGMGPSQYSAKFTGTARVLFPNLIDQESYFSTAIDQTATGIKFGGTSLNHSTSYKWAYIAFA